VPVDRRSALRRTAASEISSALALVKTREAVADRFEQQDLGRGESLRFQGGQWQFPYAARRIATGEQVAMPGIDPGAELRERGEMAVHRGWSERHAIGEQGDPGLDVALEDGRDALVPVAGLEEVGEAPQVKDDTPGHLVGSCPDYHQVQVALDPGDERVR